MAFVVDVADSVVAGGCGVEPLPFVLAAVGTYPLEIVVSYTVDLDDPVVGGTGRDCAAVGVMAAAGVMAVVVVVAVVVVAFVTVGVPGPAVGVGEQFEHEPVVLRNLVCVYVCMCV